MSAEAQNLEAITKAIIQHNGNCEYPVVQIEMCAYEVERLGWDEIRGIPIIPTDSLPEGRFRLVCDKPPEKPATPVGTAKEKIPAGERGLIEMSELPNTEED